MKMESPGGIIAVESSITLETILEATFSHHPSFSLFMCPVNQPLFTLLAKLSRAVTSHQ